MKDLYNDNVVDNGQPPTPPEKPKKKKRSIWGLLFGLIFGLIISGVAVVGFLIATIYPQLPSMDELKNYQPKLPLQVFSADGVMLGQFGEERRIFLDVPDTPPMLIHAILSAEDEHFYEHHGVDFNGIGRAVIGNLASGHLKSGGSTITMQVARNFFLTKDKTFTRKFNEVLLSYKIEHSLSKDEILSLYMNQIYLGQRAYGFAEAAQTYFGKPIDKLSIAQYAVLAGLPKAPSAYNPVVNPKRSHIREVYVLGRMLKLGYIDQAQYDKAVEEPITPIKGTKKDFSDAGGYIAEMARMYLYSEYGDKIYTSGFKVYTTINSQMQQHAYDALRNGLLNYDLSRGYNGPEKSITLTTDAENPTIEDAALDQFDSLTDYGDLLAAIVIEVDKNHLEAVLRNDNHVTILSKDSGINSSYFDGKAKNPIKVGSVIRVMKKNDGWKLVQIPEVQGALVALNPTNGAIKALMGGFDFTLNNYNHVMQAQRQPGSSFKPFIYSAALENGLTPETVIDDSPACYPSGSGGDWCPKNDNNKFMGPLSLRQGLTLSRNLVTVKILNKITPQVAIDYVTKFGFPKNQFQPYLTMGLGANEVTPIQMASAYAVFANGGYLLQPYFITKITDANDNVIATTAPQQMNQSNQVIDPRNAFIMTSILKDVAKYGTGAKAYKELHRDDVAGKTGTTNDSKDVWFDGFTPDLVTVAWVGYDQPKSLGRQYGATLALPIWIDFMKYALKDSTVRSLPMPAGMVAIPEGTWNGNTEYYYDSMRIGAQYESDLSSENESGIGQDDSGNAEDILNGDETSNGINKTDSSSVNNNVQSGNSPAPIEVNHTNARKPVDINDIIGSIQD